MDDDDDFHLHGAELEEDVKKTTDEPINPGNAMARSKWLPVVKFGFIAMLVLLGIIVVLGVIAGICLGMYLQKSTVDDSTVHGSYPAVRVASTGPVIDESTMTLTTTVIDGVQLISGDRVLLKDETNPKLNGIYVVVSGNGLQRAPDMNRRSQITQGNSVLVLEGAVNGGASYMLFLLASTSGGTLNSVTGYGLQYRNSTGVALGSLLTPTPTDGEVLVHDSSNPTTVKWAGSASGLGGSTVYTILYQVANATGPNDTPVEDTWVTRSINTLLAPSGATDVEISAASKTFTLNTTGTWTISASAPAYRCNQHKIRLVNATTGTEIAVGSAAYSVNADTSAQTNSVLEYTWTVASAPLVLAIQHQVQIVDTDTSFGIPSAFNVSEVYTNIQLIKGA